MTGAWTKRRPSWESYQKVLKSEIGGYCTAMARYQNLASCWAISIRASSGVAEKFPVISPQSAASFCPPIQKKPPAWSPTNAGKASVASLVVSY